MLTMCLAPCIQARANTRKTVFLTGCSGFVGVYTLRALCLTPSVASVICLVRGTSVSAEERLRDACKAHRVHVS